MREYAKVSPLFWTRGSGKRLRGDSDAQVLALYLVTCPAANMIGVYYHPLVSMAHETGLGLKRTTDTLARLGHADFAHYDHDSEMVWVPNMAAYQIGEDLKPGDKRRGGVIGELAKVQGSKFAAAFVERYGQAYNLPAGSPFEAPSKPLASPFEGVAASQEAPSKGKPDPREEQEQEQEQEKEQEQERPRTRGEAEEVWAVYVETLKRYRPRRRPGGLTEKDRKGIKARLKEGFPLDDLKAAVRGLFLSPWYLGQNERQTEYLELRHALNSIATLAAVADEAEPRPEPPKPEPPPAEGFVDPVIIAEFERRMFGDDKGAA